MKLTKDIERRLAEIQSEDHTVMEGMTEALYDGVGPLFDEPGKKFFPLRPSGCLKPMRDLYYDLVNYYTPGTIPKKDFEPRIKIVFQFGHLTEILVKKICAHAFNVECEQQYVVYGKLTDKEGKEILLGGSIDWAMTYDGQLVLVDSKSIGSFPFKKAPKEENIAQLQLYMHSDWGRKNNVNKAMLIYMNKDNCELKCIEFAYDPVLAQNILDRLVQVYEYFKRGEIPPREYLAGLDWQANYSQYIEYDNQEFAVAKEARETKTINDFYKPGAYVKDEIRIHVEKYGNKIIKYVDADVYIVYGSKKLNLIKEEK